MSRVARNVVCDIPYHVIHRGNNRQKIFFKDPDYSFFLSLMSEAKSKYLCRIYAYVLMPNHIHMILEPSENAENMAKFMKLIAQKYSQHVNKIYKRSGTLWEGRFKSSPVSKDSYLLACMRYIELNPVRAKIVEKPDLYRWSSCLYKIGNSNPHGLCDEDPAYCDFGRDISERRSNYRKWLAESVPSEELELIRKSVNKEAVFGNSEFREKLEKMLGRSFSIRGRGRPAKS